MRFHDGELVYTTDSLGNQILDYSYCGYESSNSPIPHVAAVAVVHPIEGDATPTIQAAIDHVAALPVQDNGFRGAILLEEGHFQLKGRLRITTSGIVIRGRGDRTILEATGLNRETLIRVEGQNDRQLFPATPIQTRYVPVGSMQVQVDYPTLFDIGDQVMIHRPSTLEWIDTLGMDEFGGGTGWLKWKPGQRDLYWERSIADIQDDQLFLDAPITTAIDEQFGGGQISKFHWPGRIERIGIENLQIRSEYDTSNPKDEDHCWNAISFENTRHAWVRNIKFRHFAGSAVAIYETGSQITVQDCISIDPISEIAGERRNTFFTMGQRTLFLRCYAARGRHDFAAGFAAAGPNAFVQCTAYLPHDFSGSVDSWASGLLLDNVQIDGHAIRLANLERDRQGAGWNAANSMIWQCNAARIECYRPPTAYNWAYGTWARFAGDGSWYEANSHITPQSLFFAQLAARQGKESSFYDDQLLSYQGTSTSRPSHEQAAAATSFARSAAPKLPELIEQKALPDTLDQDRSTVVVIEAVAPDQDLQKQQPRSAIILKNGLLLHQGRLISGRQMDTPWWRGDDRPYEAHNAQPAVTRFVPGRTGLGYTDQLSEVVEFMEEERISLFHHNYGLWYDRRRDDHERVRRMEPDSWAPFYEQPFARSGQGEAWDRLSKYDLSRYNPWYWTRLKDFADAAERRGKLLMHQHYFQHNILEAGAHWADSPWRPANNINDTGFPEPPNYAGDKRIFFAEHFYDVGHPLRTPLHRAYIRQCLDQFKDNSNVLQSISYEYTGPFHFVAFWLDVIAEWEQENTSSSLICLSTTKDVQDSILALPQYAALIDVIDIRYWAYRSDGSLYTPAGGIDLAPRQHARLESPGKRSFESVYRSVSEYRLRFPDKAVIYSENKDVRWAWAILMAGGSLPPAIADMPGDFYELTTRLRPVQAPEDGTYFQLSNEDGEAIFYVLPQGEVVHELPKTRFRVDCFDTQGTVLDSHTVHGRKTPFSYQNTTNEPAIISLQKCRP